MRCVRQSFYEKVGNTFIHVDWAENITSSWQKLSKKLEQISEKIYKEYFPNNDCNYVVSHTPTFSPADNVGALLPEQKQICRSVYREFDSEEMRLYRGEFRSDRERVDYMRRMGMYKNIHVFIVREYTQRYASGCA